MSNFNTRQSGPEVYNYAGDNNRSSYIAGQTVPQNQVFVNTPSNVVTVNPVNTTNPLRNSQQRASRAAQIVSNDTRFANYNVNEYKYNLFSIVDEPWNRCLQLGKCGSCPGNQCIARQTRRGFWLWN